MKISSVIKNRFFQVKLAFTLVLTSRYFTLNGPKCSNTISLQSFLKLWFWTGRKQQVLTNIHTKLVDFSTFKSVIYFGTYLNKLQMLKGPVLNFIKDYANKPLKAPLNFGIIFHFPLKEQGWWMGSGLSGGDVFPGLCTHTDYAQVF